METWESEMVANASRISMNEDRELERKVIDYLAERSVPPLRRVAVQARHGQVTLRGRVGTFYEKQLLLNCFRAVPGIVGIVDCVDVA
jgi:osmotically-inducible protein OsmY